MSEPQKRLNEGPGSKALVVSSAKSGRIPQSPQTKRRARRNCAEDNGPRFHGLDRFVELYLERRVRMKSTVQSTILNSSI